MYPNPIIYKDIATMLLKKTLRSSKIFVEKMKGENEATSWRNLSECKLFTNYKVFLNFNRTPISFTIKKRMPFWTPSYAFP